jgi:hypothetical protein
MVPSKLTHFSSAFCNPVPPLLDGMYTFGILFCSYQGSLVQAAWFVRRFDSEALETEAISFR